MTNGLIWLTLVGCGPEPSPGPEPLPSSPRPGEVWRAPIAGDLVWVPGGTFAMGSPDDEPERNADEGPVHPVTVGGSWVTRSEVSQELYEHVVGSNPSGWTGCRECPVDQVSWYEALQFANALSAMEGLEPVYTIEGIHARWRRDADGYRLLTEAEWEHAARGGERFRFAGSDDAAAIGWVRASSDGRTHPSCSKPVNGFGLCDMTGNVREWVWDQHGDYEDEAQVDPTGSTTATFRVIRGGSWNGTDRISRVAFRFSQLPDYRSMSLGIRLTRPARDE